MKINIYHNTEASGAISKFPAYYNAAVSEYAKRLAPYLRISLHAGKYNSVKKPKNNARFVRISKTGASCSSEDMAREFQRLTSHGISEFVFFLGFDGLEGDFYNLQLTCTDISVPLQIILLYEQIYRVIKIINNEPYHK